MLKCIFYPGGMKIVFEEKGYAGSVAGCFLDGSRVASGWAGGVAARRLGGWVSRWVSSFLVGGVG